MPNRIVVDVENRSGTKQGPGPIATVTRMMYGDALSRAAEFSFDMPARDSRADLLSVKTSVVRIYDGGSQVFVGVVESLETAIDNRGRGVLTVSGRNMLAELGEKVYSNRITISGTGGPSIILAGMGWGLVSGAEGVLTGHTSTGNGIYAEFGVFSSLADLIRIHELTGEGFVVSAEDDYIIWLRSTIADSGVRALQGGSDPIGLAANANACIIQALERVEDAHEVAWRVYPYGGGIGGDSQIKIVASSYTTGTYGDFYVDTFYNSVSHTLGLGYAGTRMERSLSFSDATLSTYSDANLLAAGDMLVEGSMRWLETHSTPQIFYRLEVAGLPASVRPGTSIRVIYEDDALSVDADFTILEIIRRVESDGSRSARLMVGSSARWPLDNSQAVVENQIKGESFQFSTQAVRTYYELAHAELFDNDATLGSRPAYVDFDLGSAIQRVQSVVMKFKVDAFRSTVKSITNAALTINAATGNTGGGGNHFHNINTVSTPTVPTGAVMFYVAGSPGYLTAGASSGYFVTQGESSHVHDLGSHTHTSSGGTASLAGGIAEIGPTATSSSYWTITIDGGAPFSSVTGPDANGYYSLDLTPDVSNTTTLRPSGGVSGDPAIHRVTMYANVGYFGLLRARIQVSAFV